MHIPKKQALLYTTLLTLLPILLVSQRSIKPFTVVKNQDAQRSEKFVSRSMHYDLDMSILNQARSYTNESMLIEISSLAGIKTLVLEPFQLLAGSYELHTEDGKQKSNARNYKFYRGKVKGEINSNVGLSILEDEVHLLIHDTEGSFEIKRLNDGSDRYAGFFVNDILEKKFIPCETDTETIEISERQSGSRMDAALECVEIHLEIDFKAYEKQDSSLTDTETWALAILGQVAVFFADSGIPITVSGIQIYTTAESDPYITSSNTSQALTAIRNKLNTEGFTGRLAHLLSGRGLGGGRAYLGVLCSNTSNYGVSGNLSSGGTTYSTYTWNINVIAHELGHNFGSPHTHDCAWNGNNTQIDDCGNVWSENNNYSTGSCYDNENKILPGNSGSIMSYCHVVGGASINLNNGFHQQVRDLIYSRYTSTTCGGSESCVGVPPINDLCSGAIRLTPTIQCNPNIYDNEYATASGVSPDFSCGTAIGEKDTWFLVQMPSNGQLIIETADISGGLSDLVLQIYTGDCENLLALGCDENSGSGNHAKVILDDIALGDEDILIRVVDQNDDEGEFGICTYSPTLPCSDIAAELLDFYNLMDGDNWTNNSGWISGANGADCNYCQWYGVSCNNNEEVTQIQLAGNNLAGSLDNSLFNLNKLEILNLSDNAISGSIPEDFASLESLRALYLSENLLTGSIPNSLVSSLKLEQLVVSSNDLSGDLPPFSYSSKVTYLDLASNNFSGCFPSGYSRFFSNGEINLLNNPNLPFNGDFYGYASDYSGFDFDRDGFCFNVNDCVDFDNTVYDGAPELCDGLDNNCDGSIDEGLDSGPNKWVGPSSGGVWNNPINWDMGHVPLACEDTEIGMDGSSVTLLQAGGQGYLTQTVKSLCLGENVMFDIVENFSLYVKNGYILNNGELNINSYSNFSNLDPNKSGIINNGVLNIRSGTYVNLSQSGINGIHNKDAGVINNYGTLIVDSNNPLSGQYGVLNENQFNNFGRLEIIGEFNMLELLVKEGAHFNNEGALIIGGESNGQGEGNARGEESDKSK